MVDDKRKPHICMIVHQDYYVDGRVRNYVNYLAEQDIPVDVICVRPRSEREATQVEKNVRVFTIPINRYENRNYIVEYLTALMHYFTTATRLYRQNRYPLFHIHNMPDFLVFAALIPKLFGAKVILDIHDPMPEFYQSKFGVEQNAFAIRVLRLQERLSAWFANHIITANENFKALFIKRGSKPEKITVIPNVPNPKLFAGPVGDADAEGFTMIYPGTVAPRYGLAIAIEAISRLKDEMPELRLRIIGSFNEHTEALRALVGKLQLDDRVSFEPAVPIDQISALMRQAQIGIYPAIPDAHMAIATPTKVQEFITVGLAVVASRIFVLTQSFSDQAILYFQPGNVDQLCEQLRRLYAHPEMRSGMIKQARAELAVTRDWEREKTKYQNLVEALTR